MRHTQTFTLLLHTAEAVSNFYDLITFDTTGSHVAPVIYQTFLFAKKPLKMICNDFFVVKVNCWCMSLIVSNLFEY